MDIHKQAQALIDEGFTGRDANKIARFFLEDGDLPAESVKALITEFKRIWKSL